MMICACIVLGACGVKPGSVEPPEGSPDPDPFPRTYPNVSTDPLPRRGLSY